MDQQQKASSSSTTKSKTNTIMKFLPKATSSVTFQNPPIFSPSKDRRSFERTHKSNLGIGFSGPMLSMIPADTRRKIKNQSDYNVVYEPTSPRVSCMGQVKYKYQKASSGNKPPTNVKSSEKVIHSENDREQVSKTDSYKSNKKLGLMKLLSVLTPRASATNGGSARKQVARVNKLNAPLYIDKAPKLGTMKRFASGRGNLSNLDWTKEVAEINMNDENDDERVIEPSSAPVIIRNTLGFDDKFIRVAGINLEPKKEINLWKRRTMPQPKPLQIS
ncbi:kinase-like domain-containing protein [Tanacetum coccineum]